MIRYFDIEEDKRLKTYGFGPADIFDHPKLMGARLFKDDIKHPFRKIRSKTPIFFSKRYYPLYYEKNKIDDNNIISNYLYSVNDFFKNGNFNMKRLNFLDFNNLAQKLKDNKVQFKQLAIEAKQKYIIDRKKLKKELLELKNQKLNELKENGNAYILYKIVSNCNNLPYPVVLDQKDFDENQIFYAKKCILNNWTFPPSTYFDKEFNEIDSIREERRKVFFEQKVEDFNGNKQDNAKSKKIVNKLTETFEWNRELYNTYIECDLNIYNTNNEEIRYKSDKGIWISENELTKYFNKVLVIKNMSTLFYEKLIVDNSWNTFKTDIFEPNENFECFTLTKNETLQKHFDNFDDKSCFLVVFEPYIQNKLSQGFKENEILQPYITLDLVDRTENNIIIKSNIILNKIYSIFSFSELNPNHDYY